MGIPHKRAFKVAVLILLSASGLIAQSRIVTGTISDEKETGMDGVNVVIKGTSQGTTTDVNGKFSLIIPHDSAHLLFTFIGYKDVEKTVGSFSTLNVGMEPATNILSELIVIGYGVQERKEVTGSVAVADGKELSAIPTANLENNIQGRLAGVNVITSGQPGSSPQVIIRGASTFAGSSQPLYVVDGVPTLDISILNPNDIETMVALKDAGAASIYGSRASNGVILITTKTGKAGSLKLTYSGYYGVQFPGKGITNLLDTQGIADLTWLAQRNSGNANPSSEMYGSGPTPVVPDYYIPAGNFDGEVNESDYDEIDKPITRANKKGTNWFDEITNNAPIQSHDIAVAGGSNNSRYYVGFNYFDQDGIIIYTGAKRYSMRINTEFKVREGIRIGENITNTYRSTSLVSPSSYVKGGDVVNALLDCYITPTIVPLYDVGGNFANEGHPKNVNPYANQYRSKDNKSFSVRTFGNVYAEIDFLKSFTFRSSFGGSFQYGRSFAFTPALPTVPNSYTEKSYDNADWNWQNTLTFKRVFHLHSLTILAGGETIKTDFGNSIEGTRSNYYSEDPDFWSLGSGDADKQTNNGYSKTPASLLGFFGRIDYSYRDRYLLSATVRRDGSSKFINHKYGTFPSATLAWRISEESFMQGVDMIQDLKLRAGYGVMGDQINATASNSYTTFVSNAGASYYDISGSNSSAQIGYANAFTGNPNGQWQVNKTINIGLDFSLFNNQWTGSIDVYKKITEKLLYQTELPGTNGTAVSAARNVGEMENKGIDLMLNYQAHIGHQWKFNSTLSFTSYLNKVIKVANNVPYFSPWDNVRIQPGQPISSFYGYKVVGLWQSPGEISIADASDGDEATVFQEAAAPGRFRYQDINNDGFISPENDRTFIGNPNPDFSAGLNVSIMYKNFDFTAFLYGVQGNSIFSITKLTTDFYWSNNGGKNKDLLYNSWTPERPNTEIPIVETVENFSTNQTSSYYVEDGSYLRLKNIQVGYNLPMPILQKTGLGTARVYVQAVNPFTFTKYTGLDPEVGGSTVAFGIGGTNFPQSKQIIVGLNLEF